MGCTDFYTRQLMTSVPVSLAIFPAIENHTFRTKPKTTGHWNFACINCQPRIDAILLVASHLVPNDFQALLRNERGIESQQGMVIDDSIDSMAMTLR